MELLYMEIFGAVNSLNKIFEMDLPVRTSLALAKLLGKLAEPFQEVEKTRTRLVTKYGTHDSITNQTKVESDSENFPKFVEEYGVLMGQKTEVIFDIVKLPQEVNGKPLMIKPAVMAPLTKFIEVEHLVAVK